MVEMSGSGQVGSSGARFAAASACLWLSACGPIDGKIHLWGSTLPDFARSEIIQNGPAIADGSSELLVAVNLMNTDGSSVKLFKPTYEIVSGGGVQGSECTTSNNNGISTCILKSTQAGVKKFSVTNIRIKLERDVVFTPPEKPGLTSAIVSAAKFNKKSAQGHELSGSVGSLHSQAVITGTSGWKIFGGPEGNAFSR
jgi:hypothetical protein